MNQITIHSPKKMLLGIDAFKQIPNSIFEMQAKRVLVLTFKEIKETIAPVLAQLSDNNIELLIDYSIINEPTASDFNLILANSQVFKPDLVLGIGGGSILDVAKLIAALTYSEQNVNQVFGINNLLARKAKLVCVSTTSGTGSEMSPNAILLDESENLKKGIISPFLVPDITCIDPVLTVSVPKGVTAATGVDAFTHCLEAFVNKFSHQMIDTYALDGMRLIYNNLKLAVENGNNLEARSAVALGSMYGGICLGPVNTTAIHALSYPLGSEFKIAHGLSNALLLTAVMEYNQEVSFARYAIIARALGINIDDDKQASQKLIEQLKIWLQELNIPLGLANCNISKDAIPALAKSAITVQRLLKNNPREIQEVNAIEIYNNAY